MSEAGELPGTTSVADFQRLDRRFVQWLFAEWIVAIAVAVSYKPPTRPEEHVAATSLLASSIVLGGMTTLWHMRARKRAAKHLQDQQERQRELLHRAFHDPHTGLPNGAAMEVRIDQHMGPGFPLSCMLVAIDGMRSANELLGHRGGDALLSASIQRLQSCLDTGDLLGRCSGGRFLVLITRSHVPAQLAALAERLVKSMGEPHFVEGRALSTNVSIGIASYPGDAGDRELLLAAADRALLAAKRGGGNEYCFAADLREPLDERNRMLAVKLERALTEGKLQLVYQPIFCKNERMVAVEALARWRDAEEGPISPAEFIPVAEATGLILPLSNWVLREACNQMAAWLRLGTTLQRMAVNVSVKQVWRSDFVPTVERILKATGLPAHCLELELTEGALATDFDTVKKHLQALRKLGVRISIDDFGTGYSSLGRVRELDADVLKIDRLFVQGASETPNGIAVVQAIVDMAHSLKLAVIAEGVETRDQLMMLRGMACDEMQGFLLALPQSAEILGAALRHAAAQSHPEQQTRPEPSARPEPHLRLVPRIA